MKLIDLIRNLLSEEGFTLEWRDDSSLSMHYAWLLRLTKGKARWLDVGEDFVILGAFPEDCMAVYPHDPEFVSKILDFIREWY